SRQRHNMCGRFRADCKCVYRKLDSRLRGNAPVLDAWSVMPAQLVPSQYCSVQILTVGKSSYGISSPTGRGRGDEIRGLLFLSLILTFSRWEKEPHIAPV